MSKEIDKGISAVSPVEGGRRPTGTGETKAAPKRFWAQQHKTEAVLRLLRGEDIEPLSRELGVTAAKISQWRDAFLAGGAESLKKRSPAEEAEYRRLNAKIGEQTMEIELLREKIRLLEAKDPLGWRRSRK
jgi:DNA-directed RNA polymerase specialized sigma subunit